MQYGRYQIQISPHHHIIGQIGQKYSGICQYSVGAVQHRTIIGKSSAMMTGIVHVNKVIPALSFCLRGIGRDTRLVFDGRRLGV
jgi:hypothetical protein